MENTVLSIKFLIFLSLMVSILIVVGTVLIAAVYQFIRDKVRKSDRPTTKVPQESTSHS